jgi:pyridoxamine 5'-phosphate oxidase
VSPAPEAFDEQSVDPDPFRQFAAWYADAEVATDDRAAAMVIATATPDGRPSARVVLLRGVDERGFVFFTNYGSRKGDELAENAQAAGLFYWRELDRQIRIEGPTTKIAPDESDAYFAQRPRGHQVGAWASPQSAPIADRAALQVRFDEAEARFADDGDPVPRPDFWGGYRLVPEMFEFWQNRADRLHDRVRYTRRADGWVIERLAP